MTQSGFLTITKQSRLASIFWCLKYDNEDEQNNDNATY